MTGRPSPVVIMAGGTGGHVFPALAVALRLRDQNIPVIWLGTQRGLEAKVVPDVGIPIEWLKVSGLRGVGTKRLLSAPLMLARAVWEALAVLRRQRPRLVLGMGGFVSGPGGLAARFLRVPLVVHEQNAIPGTTNVWLARIASQVLQAFPDSFPAGRAVTVGNPVRVEICALRPPRQRWTGRDGAARLLVLGGSQGARALNQLVPQALRKLAGNRRPEVWHQTGSDGYDATRNDYQEVGVDARLVPFIDAIDEAYDWADLVLCRSGALTVSELSAAGVGSILVPFPHAIDDHQTANAQVLERTGAAFVLQQRGLDASRLAAELSSLLSDREQLLKMAEAAHALAAPDATERVVQACLGGQRINVS